MYIFEKLTSEKMKIVANEWHMEKVIIDEKKFR